VFRVRCRVCGWNSSQRELDAHYADHSKYTYDQTSGKESEFDFRRFSVIADHSTSSLTDPTLEILDIGCATGGSLACLRERGFTRVLGSDPSPACARAAQALHGVSVHVASLTTLREYGKNFDVVLMVGVLEHVREVRSALATAVSLLKEGGVFYCAQPDVGAFAETNNAPFQQFSTEHINYFSVDSLSRVLASVGLAPRRSWHWLVEWRSGVTDSVVSLLAKKSCSVLNAGL
jgi:2-polyprenyl-3-methyl-5-hydroxy-6-metoxy-1,4-benzoquinol methylase